MHTFMVHTYECTYVRMCVMECTVCVWGVGGWGGKLWLIVLKHIDALYHTGTLLRSHTARGKLQ